MREWLSAPEFADYWVFHDPVYQVVKHHTLGQTRPNTSVANQYARRVVQSWFEFRNALLHPELPFTVQEVKEKGLGIVAKRELKWSQIKDVLCGALDDFVEEDFNWLVEQGYPSLYDGNCVLWGPLSLVNHASDARLCIQCPSLRGEGGAFGGYRRVFAGERSNGVCFEEGEEITMTYGRRDVWNRVFMSH